MLNSGGQSNILASFDGERRLMRLPEQNTDPYSTCFLWPVGVGLPID